MGLFRKKAPVLQQEDDYSWMTVDEALAISSGVKRHSSEGVSKEVEELCTQLKTFRAQQEETKKEFGQVTQYLADIQRFDQLGEADRADIADAARMILSLDAERIKFQKSDTGLSEAQYRTMEMYASEFPDKLSELEKHEEYLRLINEDLRSLEGEKGSIGYEHDHASQKKTFLNKMTYVVIFLVLTVFIVLLMLADSTKKDFTVPYFITGVCAIGYIVYYIYAIGECKTQLKKTVYMMNRANVLLNKVKIKYVNTTNVLDYAYDKYGVNSVNELRYVWERYARQKEAQKRYMKNTQLLTSYSDRMMLILAKNGIEQVDAWVHQPEVFLDRGELADFKDAVSNRRNKLRAQLDFNMRQQDGVLNEIEAMKNKYTGDEALIDYILQKNGIT